MIGDSASSGAIVQSIAASGCTWVSVERPTDAEIDTLSHTFSLRRTDLEASLDRSGPTGLWRRDDHSVITLHVPIVSSSKQRSERGSTPVTLFVGHDFVVTVHTGEIRQLIRLFRQFESDELARDEAFSSGVNGVAFAVMQRLLDAVVAARASVDRSIAVIEDGAARASDSNATSREAIVGATRLRSEARTIHRLAHPLPAIVRALAKLEPMVDSDGEDWDRLGARADRLVMMAEQDLATTDGMIGTATAIAQLESARSLRAILVVVALSLPVIAVVAILSLPNGNPLANVPNAFAVATALAGVVFLVALFALRRRGLL